MKILVTGASGFIGSFIVEEALRQGMETWAAVRRGSSRQYLQDPRIHFIELDFSSQQQLEEQLRGQQFDYVVHAAGATKCLHAADFYEVNAMGTIRLARALVAVAMPLRRLVYISSLSVFGAIREQQPYEEITEHDTPRPNTHYGRSKLQAEHYLEMLASGNDEVVGQQGKDFPYIVLRPTGVYGPREKDYYLMAKSISRHSDFAVGFRRQDITFVYVQDVVQAIFLALDHGMSGRKYFLTDGEVYQSTDFSELIRHELGQPWVFRLKAPLWLLRVVTYLGEYWGRIMGRPTTLNNDKYYILRQRNWRCDIEPTMDELGYHPHYKLDKGVKLTMAWYRQQGWL